MLTVTEARLVEYTRRHPDAASALFRWAGITRVAVWRNFVQLRMVFKQDDQVGDCTVFNIKGNKYRLITWIDYGLQTVTLKYFLTHQQYDRERWKKDC